MLAGIPVDRVWACVAEGSVIIDGGRVSDDEVVRLAALAHFAGNGRRAGRRTRKSLRALELPPTPYFLVRHPDGVVVAVHPDHVVAHVSRPGEYRGFDPTPIRQRLGLHWSERAAATSG